MGRPTVQTTVIDGRQFTSETQYDHFSRPYKGRDASGRWSKTEFTGRGFPAAVCESSNDDVSASCSEVYQRTTGVDPFGNVTHELRANNANLTVVRSYSPLTGRLEELCAGPHCSLVQEAYTWDAVGNLRSQAKEGRYFEKFDYDVLDRLEASTLLVRNGVRVNEPLQSYRYDGLGNICSFNGVAQTYGEGSGCPSPSPPPSTSPQPPAPNDPWLPVEPAPGGETMGASTPGDGASTMSSPALPAVVNPHAIRAAHGPAGVTAFHYDGRGNQIYRDAPGSTDDRQVRYNTDDQAVHITTGGGADVRFWYLADGSRYKRLDGGIATLYLGNVEVQVMGKFLTYKRTVGGVVQQTFSPGSTVQEDYLFHDRLGSLVRITDRDGVVRKNLDFASFGGRRDPASPAGVGTGTSITTRGFTGHEQVDSVGLVHMNARLYDPATGRFLQTDPMVQDASNAQGWNAYSYVLNNPLRYTDPTGMLGVEERQWLSAAIIIVAVVTQQYWAAVKWGTAAGTAWLASAGFASGAIATKSFQGGVFGAVTALMGGAFSGANGGFAGWAVKSFTGGVMSALQGGDFGHAFLSAGLTAAFMPQVGRIANDVGRTITGALVGGTISKATGGKFANGAVTGAIMAAMS